MILIINQHKGDFSQLLDCLDNYEKQVKHDNSFFMSLVIDQQLTPDQVQQLNHYIVDLRDVLLISFHDYNEGLAKSRLDAIREFKRVHPTEDVEYVIFGATNTLFKYELDFNLKNALVDGQGEGIKRITLIPCDYTNDKFQRNYEFLSMESITLATYLTSEDKPDFTLMFPGDICNENLLDVMNYNEDEIYYPEELYMLNYFRVHELDATLNTLRIYHTAIQVAWYNIDGMSMNFNRQFVRDNRKGFLRRAYVMIRKFEDGELLLNHNKLKGLIYDYVTLGGDVNAFKSDLTRELYWWAMRKWIENKDYNHCIEFHEDIKS